MKVFSAIWVTSALEGCQLPEEGGPEVAFAGRSNVGKSSLINRLLVRKQLARVSRTPGCTRRIHFIQVNHRYWFVDLPGYGFAKLGRAEARQWGVHITHYLATRRSLRAVVLLLDLRRGLGEQDRQLAELVTKAGVTVVPVATKTDKLGGNERRNLLARLAGELALIPGAATIPPVACSSLTGLGIDRLWERLGQLLEGESPAGDPPATGGG